MNIVCHYYKSKVHDNRSVLFIAVSPGPGTYKGPINVV